MKSIEGRCQVEIGCVEGAVLELVLDPSEYSTLDNRIVRIVRVDPSPPLAGVRLRVWQRPRMPGSRLPEPPVEVHYRVSTVGDSTVVEQVLAPWPSNRINHLLGRYRASWLWYPVGEGLVIERTVTYGLRLLPRLLFGPLLRRRLGCSLEREMRAVKKHLETEAERHRSGDRSD